MQAKRAARLGLLLLLKDGYLFVKNSFGLVWHPFKTLAAMSREKDRSQQVLILGWPAYILAAGAAFIYAGRRLLATEVAWGWGAKSTALMFLVLSSALSVYLFYWWIRLWRSH